MSDEVVSDALRSKIALLLPTCRARNSRRAVRFPLGDRDGLAVILGAQDWGELREIPQEVADCAGVMCRSWLRDWGLDMQGQL